MMKPISVWKQELAGGTHTARLASLYCCSPEQTAAHAARYAAVLDGLEATFGAHTEAGLYSAPGRTEIGGNHTDHQHGRVLAGSVNIDMIAAAAPNGLNQLRVQSEGYDLCVIDLGDLAARKEEENTTMALLRGECCRAVAKAGKRDSGQIETGIVREAISVTGMGSGGRYLVGQVTAMRSEIFNTSLSAEGRAVLLYHVERMNEESANALLKVMEEPPEGVLFLLTADSLASVLPTIRSRCISFAVAPVSPADCTRYCAAQGVDKKTAALYSELFDGHIGTVLAVARDEARAAQVEKALELARAAAARDSYTAAVLLAAYEKDKAAAAALLTDFRAVAAAGLRSSPRAPVQGTQARQAVRLADAALQRLGAQVNPKVVLTVFAAKLRTV